MIVDPSVTGHLKYRRLKRLIGPIAMEVLVLLWGHCQEGQRGEVWRNIDDDYIEDVCRWESDRGRLVEALIQSRWIEKKANGSVVVRSWEFYNNSLVKNWKNGVRGGRPKKPSGNPTGTQQEPKHDIGLTQQEPNVGFGVSDEIRLDRIREEERRREKRALEVADAPGRDPKPEAEEPHLPTVEEVVAHGNFVGVPPRPARWTSPHRSLVVAHGHFVGVPPEFCQDWHDRKTTGRYWFNTRGELIDWKHDLQTQWTKNRHTWKPPAKGLPTVEEGQTALDAIPITDVARREIAIKALMEAKERERR